VLKGLTVAIKGLAVTLKGLILALKPLAVTFKGLIVALKRLAVSVKGLTVAVKRLVVAIKRLIAALKGLIVTTEPLMVKIEAYSPSSYALLPSGVSKVFNEIFKDIITGRFFLPYNCSSLPCMESLALKTQSLFILRP
jgi:hypothetical protein